MAGPAPAEALAGRDAVVHLAGETVAQRWNDEAKRAHPRQPRDRARATSSRACAPPGRRARGVLVSASAVGYYGKHGDERRRRVDAGPATTSWPASASPGSARPRPPRSSACASSRIRTGVVLDTRRRRAGKMLPPFKLGVGGPVAGGDQYMPWIHVDDVVGLYLAALDGDALVAAPVNAAAPEPVTNKEFSKALGPRAAPPRRRAGARPSRCALLYGEMAEIVTEGQRAVPAARRWSSATPSGTRTSTRRCARRRCGLTPRRAG